MRKVKVDSIDLTENRKSKHRKWLRIGEMK